MAPLHVDHDIATAVFLFIFPANSGLEAISTLCTREGPTETPSIRRNRALDDGMLADNTPTNTLA
jgi:hypothetical protein